MLRRLFLIVIVFLLLMSGYYLLNEFGILANITDVDRMRDWVSQLGYWGPVTITTLMAIAIIINPIPSAPIALAAGAVYGHTWGTIYVITGAATGALAAFWLARLLGYELMVRVFGNRLRLGWLGSQNVLTGMVFISRLIPFLSFDLVSYGAGLTPIKAWRFTLATLAGLMPASFLLAHFGGELATASYDRVLGIVLLLGALTLVPIIVMALVKWYKQTSQPMNHSPPKSKGSFPAEREAARCK